ncbi:respiratory nitrate reductase subunit gamma, partial [Fibrobacterota bacterium]
CIQALAALDSFFRIEFMSGIISIGMPAVMISGIILALAVAFLLARRIFEAKVRYISLISDYFPLFLILAIALSGILMRYFTKVDIVGVKELTMGLVSLKPVIPNGVGSIFFIHLFLVSILLTYFPFSKLMHMGGVFLSPTRNLTADTRRNRHINPWNPKVKTHTYEEYENEFRQVMVGANLPVDKKE